jgi:mannose-6-phosphate isomerase-like protein (cupin superfamily)
MSDTDPRIKASPFRRVVTTRGADGRSRVLLDVPGRQFGTLHELWMTDGDDAPLSQDPDDAVLRPFRISPTPGGSVFRFVAIEPESQSHGLTDEARRAQVRAAFAAVGSEDALVETSRHPAMHQTPTIDYIIVLAGRLSMLLDEGEVELGPHDVVVQRGTNHAWVNRGDTPALLAAVLISADDASTASKGA